MNTGFLLGCVVSLCMFVSDGVAEISDQETVSAWEPRVGDTLHIDVRSNVGYLIHDDGEFLVFPVVTGQKRYVYYIGRYYFAATPVADWTVQSVDIKDDRVTFGKTGRFFRLYQGEESTSYGIHGYDPEDWMFREGDRYRSMGCIIVREEILDIISKTYEINSENLSVSTRSGAVFGESQQVHIDVRPTEEIVGKAFQAVDVVATFLARSYSVAFSTVFSSEAL